MIRIQISHFLPVFPSSFTYCFPEGGFDLSLSSFYLPVFLSTDF
jgi:hypothetical protein